MQLKVIEIIYTDLTTTLCACGTSEVRGTWFPYRCRRGCGEMLEEIKSTTVREGRY
jgi:hypothetical protein